MNKISFGILGKIITLGLCLLVYVGCSAGVVDDPDNPPTTYSISGRVTLNGAGISGVTVSLSGAGSASVTTDNNGDYRFSGLSNGSYTITSSLTGYTFDPGSISVTISGGNRSGNDFTALPTTFSLSGRVSQGSSGLAGVTITLSGNGSGTTTTNAAGDYGFNGLTNGTYTVTPSLAGYEFEPTHISVTILNGNQSGQSFAATPAPTYIISGMIQEDGAGLGGVLVSLSGDRAATVTTDSGGRFSFVGLSAGSYVLIPSKAGYFFEPDSIDRSIGNGDSTSNDFSASLIRLPSPDQKAVSGLVAFPEQCPVDPTSLRVQSALGAASLNADATFSGLQVVDEGLDQVVFILDAADTPIMMGLVSANDLWDDEVTIGPREMALGLISINPYLMIFPQAQRAQLLYEAEYHEDFNGLVDAIAVVLTQAPQTALDYEANPHIYNAAMGIGIKLLDAYGDNFAGKPEGLRVASPVGPEDVPHIDDPEGSNVTFVNPKTIFYGVDINPPAGGISSVHVCGRSSLYQMRLGWPPIIETPPVERLFDLGDGAYTLTFYKGFNFSVNGWLNIETAPGKATIANFLKAVSIVFDAVGAVKSVLKLDDRRIDMIVSYLVPPNISIGSRLENAFRKKSWFDALTKIIEIVSEQWENISYWLYQQWPGDGTAVFLKSAGTVFKSAANAIPYVKAVVLGVKAANEYIPFGYDLVTAPPILTYSVRQTNGVLSEVSMKIPPVAIFEYTPLQAAVSETVAFDASGSYDDRDSASSLLVRWDFEGDGVWDTSWTTEKNATHSYSERGAFRAVLEVMDSDNEIGSAAHDVLIGSQDELKIVLTWGTLPTDLDSHLYTPVIDGYTYHVYFSDKYQDLTNPPYVMLDLDDTSSYGPETIWFERIFPGTYTYAVHNWSLDGDLTSSGATVTVIGRDGVLATFTVPVTGIGEWWTVFEMDGETGTITPVNTIGSSALAPGAAAQALPAKIKKDVR